MSPTPATEYEPIDASPVKLFFVSMLTRDIPLEEAILDLLDNCVDGILRLGTKQNPNHISAITQRSPSTKIPLASMTTVEESHGSCTNMRFEWGDQKTLQRGILAA